MSSFESNFSEAGNESDAGGNGNFSDTGSLMTNPAFRIAPGPGGDGGTVTDKTLLPSQSREHRRSVVSDTELEQQQETDSAVSDEFYDIPSSIIKSK